MSLQVWLPLNGNLNNQGLSNVVVTNNGATVDNNGKIGKCYKFDGTYITVDTGLPANPTVFSFCSWVKLISGYTKNNGCHLVALSNNCRICFSKDGSAIRFIGNNAGLTCSASVLDSALSAELWYHVAVTFNNGIVKMYLNGIKVADTNLGVTSLNLSANMATPIGSYSTETSKAYMNDYRIYDHCLSAKEIKEISKGLILHYKLDNAGWGNENLLKNSYFDSVYSVTGWNTAKNGTLCANNWGGYNSGVGNQANVYHAHIQEYENSYVYNYHRTSDESWLGISQNITAVVTPGETYTFSCEMKRISGVNYPHGGLYTYANTSATSNTFVNSFSFSQFSSVKDSEWHRYFYTFTIPSGTYTSHGSSWYIYGMSGGNGEFLMRRPKLEKSSSATPWCPNSADTIYSKLGLNSNIEYDCSGYNRNGTKNGNITWDIDSPRYITSYSALSDYPIKAEVNIPSCDNMTIAFWTKITTFGTASSGLFATSNMSTDPTDYNDTAMAQRDSSIDLKGISGSSKRFIFTVPSTGQWHHCAFVYDGSKVYYYQDGKKINEEACTIGALKSYQYFYLGYSKAGGVVRKTLGKWSDLRIYATALSANDIAELYQTAISADKNGNLYCYEFKEV